MGGYPNVNTFVADSDGRESVALEDGKAGVGPRHLGGGGRVSILGQDIFPG